ncbi:hypothetical protein OEZ86_000983 [Tetradesmus obliquus]|nr:hypothetical protein OEZ86_000983 [Tetradesmus obliquus]
MRAIGIPSAAPTQVQQQHQRCWSTTHIRCAAPVPGSARAHSRHSIISRADESTSPAAAQPAAEQPPAAAQQQSTPSASMSSMEGTQKRVRTPDSTDPIASFMSRRFGLAGGLAWLSFLAVGTLGEQVKTRMEVAAEKAGTVDVADSPAVTLPSGVSYKELRVGGGQQPSKGLLVVLDYIGRADGVEFENTKARGKPIVLLFGGRPFVAGMSPGLEEALKGMKAGGKRIVSVPPELGFGDRGYVMRPTEHVPDKQGLIPPGARLEYEVELLRVSIPPS